jgi:hypothetical protein
MPRPHRPAARQRSWPSADRPSLQRGPGSDERSAPDPGLEPLRVLEAAHRCLREIGPTLVAVDDLHWVDDQTLALCHRRDGTALTCCALHRIQKRSEFLGPADEGTNRNHRYEPQAERSRGRPTRSATPSLRPGPRPVDRRDARDRSTRSYCFAGDLELASWCDLRIAAENAEFPAPNRGRSTPASRCLLPTGARALAVGGSDRHCGRAWKPGSVAGVRRRPATSSIAWVVVAPP